MGVCLCALVCGCIAVPHVRAQITPVAPIPAQESQQQSTAGPTQQKLETSQQANDKLRSLSSSAARQQPHDYVIGPGDVVSLQVFDVPELSREVRVSQTGTIGIPLVPVRLRVSGLTEIQAQQKISEVLEANGLVSHADVSVSVRDRKSKPITVVGAVAHPMVYQADRPVTLIELLAEAGGLAGDASDTVIVTRQSSDAVDASEPPEIAPEDTASAADVSGSHKRATDDPKTSTDAESKTGQAPASASKATATNAPQTAPDIPPPAIPDTITVNLNQILERGDMSNNIILQAGDVVTVPHAGVIYALGAVSRPGGFVVGSDRHQLTTLKLLALAGGLTNTARSDHAVIIRRDSNGQQSEVEVNLKNVVNRKTEDLQLEPSDILYVPKSAVKITLLQAAALGVAIGSAVLIYRLIP